MTIACVDKVSPAQNRRMSDAATERRDRRARPVHTSASAESVLLARIEAAKAGEADRAAAFAAQVAATRKAEVEAAQKARLAEMQRAAAAKQRAAQVAWVFDRRRRQKQRGQAIEDAILL